MLDRPYHWIEADGAAFLRYNAGTVAWVRTAHGAAEVHIKFQRVEINARAASLRQGRRFIERWIGARSGPPGLGTVKRRR